ncbi:MAG: Na-translocating system protein MpsB [Verrucomicrobia bacterium]|nr:Na-translocating system protein MpsB [Verrucomicrobiota bacterium]
MLNRAEVGDQLSKQGVNTPESPRFSAVEHDTTTNEIAILQGSDGDFDDRPADGIGASH